ncbi:unnamed protein product [Caretta caretta]
MAWQASTCNGSPGSWTTRSTLSAYANRTSRNSGSQSTNSVSPGQCRSGQGGPLPPPQTQLQQDSLHCDLVIHAEEQDRTPIPKVVEVPLLRKQGEYGSPS